MADSDSLLRFLFDSRPVRGESVHLDASWRAALERTDYPQPVAEMLGQAMAASALLASTLKFDGSLTLQLQGDGAVPLLVVQCSDGLVMRGMAQWQGEVDDRSFVELAGDSARLVVTLEQSGQAERYQGIVPLEGESLSDALEAYFARSEQLPTRLWLAADGERASGLLLQVLPDARSGGEDWNHVTTLAETVTREELLHLPAPQLLHRLYHEEDLRLFDTAPVAFRCGCSREKVADMLRSLGREELEATLEEQGNISVQCEFCARDYAFDSVDVAALFADDPITDGSHGTH